MGEAGGGRRNDGHLLCTSTRVTRTARGWSDASPHPAVALPFLEADMALSGRARPFSIYNRMLYQSELRAPKDPEGFEPPPVRWVGLSNADDVDDEPMAGREREDARSAIARRRIASTRRWTCHNSVVAEGFEPPLRRF